MSSTLSSTVVILDVRMEVSVDNRKTVVLGKSSVRSLY